VFEMLTGIPDVNGATTASRNPLVVNQHTLVNALEGYEKYYFLGGSATWGNIRGLFTHNIPGLHVFEEGDYDAPQVDGWGVSDVVLFDKPKRRSAARSSPSSPSSRPRAITGPSAFPTITPASSSPGPTRRSWRKTVRRPAAYNGMRYLDFALGSFFAKVKDSPAFRNTVFFMYGDHGNPSTRETPWQKLLLTGYHVPCVIYAPASSRRARASISPPAYPTPCRLRWA